jgi:hypothetical protein
MRAELLVGQYVCVHAKGKCGVGVTKLIRYPADALPGCEGERGSLKSFEVRFKDG